jgi:predicted porin
VAFAAWLFSAPAFAQSRVTPCGVRDTDIDYVSRASAAGDHVIRMRGITGERP